MTFDDNPKIVDAFQHWFGIAIDSTQDVLSKLWQDNDPDLNRIYNITQSCYAKQGITCIELHRACTSTLGNEKVLCSWTKDRELAKSYFTDVIRDNTLNTLLTQTFPVCQVLFDVEFSDYYFEAIDDTLGMMPCDECIIIN